MRKKGETRGVSGWTHAVKATNSPISPTTREIWTVRLGIDRIPVYHLLRCFQKSWNVKLGCSRTGLNNQPNLYPLAFDYKSTIQCKRPILKKKHQVQVIYYYTYVEGKPEILRLAVRVPRHRVLDRPVDDDPGAVHPPQRGLVADAGEEGEFAKVFEAAQCLGRGQEAALPVVHVVVVEGSLQERKQIY